MGGVMGSCGGFCCPDVNADKLDDKFTDGPVKERRCTDIVFIPLLILAQIVFIIVTIIGVKDGDPTKLYKPRDFRGAYCGVKDNWNHGPITTDQPYLSYTMNVSSMADTIMKQTICSTYAADLMTNHLLTSQAEKDAYMCDCCLSPCPKCDGAMDLGGDLSSGNLASVITSKMSELTDPAKAKDLFAPGGANGAAFSTDAFWTQVTKYVNLVCLPECMNTVDENTTRQYIYMPSPDSEYYGYWNKALNASSSTPGIDELKSTIESSFTFKAFPRHICPYHESLCVPMPGMSLKELSTGSKYCTFEMASEVVDAVGQAVASVYEGMGFTAFGGAASQEFGKLAGDFQETVDMIVLTSVLSFVVGLAFLVLLRFFIGACVWISVLLTILAFFFFGFFAFIISGQCEGVGILETGKQVSVAMAVASTTKLKDAISGGAVPSEAMSPPNGQDYRGRQQYTRLGKKCDTWETQTRMSMYKAANYAELAPADVTKNYCRNPYNETDSLKAKTIWCVTTDPNVAWEECIPIGVIQPECKKGYAVDSKTMRDALYVSSYIIWILGGCWIVLIFIMVNRIRLAIALNKVAAVFVATHPTVLLIPIFQSLLAIAWMVTWCFSVSFLLSQVPDSYTPKESYHTYAEAFGTVSGCAVWETGDQCKEIAGKCTNTWPTGSVWRDTDCDVDANNMPKCWRCAPPRYVLDARFWISLFVYLWNNAFNVALGQMLLAMCVSLWFFRPAEASPAPAAADPEGPNDHEQEQDKRCQRCLRQSCLMVLRGIRNLSSLLVFEGVWVVLRYHIGTVAFGSFIVALVQFIRYLLHYFEKQAAAQKNRIVVLLLKGLQCIIWCFEKCIKFLNKNAYIQTALMGTSFCVSAKNAFYLILRNALRFGTMAVLGSVVEAIGFFMIIGGTGCIGYLLLRAQHPDVEPFLPLIVIFVISYVVARLFMSVFGMSVDTCLQCFLAAEELKLDCVPPELKNFVEANARKIEGGKD